MCDLTQEHLQFDTTHIEYQARPHDELIRELLDPRIPKSEREHAAAREIEALSAERDALSAEVERLREVLGGMEKEGDR